jgi:hypothetical protein
LHVQRLLATRSVTVLVSGRDLSMAIRNEDTSSSEILRDARYHVAALQADPPTEELACAGAGFDGAAQDGAAADDGAPVAG